MAKKVWTFELEGQRHVVEVEHSRWRGQKDIMIDGVPFERTQKICGSGESVHHFDISGVPCVLDIKYTRNKLTGYTYGLFVSGKKVSERGCAMPTKWKRPRCPKELWLF